MIALAASMFSCDENEVMPAYSKVSTATSTVASLSSSKPRPLPSESIVLTLMYVNPSSDPLTTVTLKAKVDAGAYTDVETFNAGSEPKDQAITHTVNFVVPAAAGAVVTFDMVITSQKEYGQIKRTSVTVTPP